MFMSLLTSQACSPGAIKGQSNTWHKSCRPWSYPDSSLGKCHLFFHWIILCSLQNKPCDLSLFLLKQKLHPCSIPQPGICWLQADIVALKVQAVEWVKMGPVNCSQLQRHSCPNSSWIKEFRRGLGTTQSIVLQILSSHSSHCSF